MGNLTTTSLRKLYQTNAKQPYMYLLPTKQDYHCSTCIQRPKTRATNQYGVPMKVFLLPTVLSSCALTPKSTATDKKYVNNYMYNKEKRLNLKCFGSLYP